MEEYNKYTQGGLLRNRYLKVADISEGSYGLVSVASDTKNGDKLVAVKYLYPLEYKPTLKKSSRASSSPAKLRTPSGQGATRSSVYKALRQEAEKEIGIHKILGPHPNISTLVDSFDSYLILEYCSRGDLYDAIQAGSGPATSQDIKDVFQQILNALEFCHSHSVYHRDLKPENILIAEDWSIKICDWGLATTKRTITDRVEFDIGSERYMAPELFDAGVEYYDASKVDLWSVGIILLTLVFHKNPFQIANYSDKRFLQFASNREVLFDIFSTMSGEMFSVLRYCLNIDPANRDLFSLRSEVDSLTYFTVDEEYYDYAEADNDEADAEYTDFSDDDEEMYKKKEEVPKIIELPAVPEEEPVHTGILKELPEKNVGPSASDAPHKSIKFDTIDDIPHNRRADALLSANTDLHPIPISSGINGKFHRNTRKPFNVASYNQSGIHTNMRSNTGKNFNREDFFTPKSVLSHYMDKYGDNQGGKNRRYSRHSHTQSDDWKLNSRSGDWKTNGRRKRSWKKSKGPKKNKSTHKPQEGSNHRELIAKAASGRVKQHLFSSSRPKKIFSDSTPTLMYGVGAMNSAGKYVPPFLRSPQHAPSPSAEPLMEKMDNLSLDDEMFHLEGDFEVGGSEGSTSGSKLLGAAFNGDFPRRHPKVPPLSSLLLQHDSRGQNTPGGGRGSNRRSTKPGTRGPRPSSVGPVPHIQPLDDLVNTTINSGGKYIPPFRRGSHSSAMPISKDRFNDHGSFNKNKFDLVLLKDGGASSVPVRSADWLHFKKDWSDYD